MWRRSYRLPSAATAAAAAAATSASSVARHGFYSGLDDSRVQRLRRSGMTFNHPRGRDTFSIAFESRLRLVPLTQMADLYGPIDASLLTAVNPDDPTSSEGNPIEKKKCMAGDARMRHVVEGKKRAEASLRAKRDWHVLVVDPVELDMVRAPIPFPSAHPAYYHDWTAAASRTVLQRRAVPEFGVPTAPEDEADNRSRICSGDETATAGGATNAEKDESASTPPSPTDACEPAGARACTSPADSAPHPPSHAYFYSRDDQRHLQQSGDTTLLPGCRVCAATLRLAADAATPASGAATTTTLHAIRQHFHTAVCVDPDIRHDRFRREEAQVEMISAYRNILYEAVEVGRVGSALRGARSSRWTYTSHGPQQDAPHPPQRTAPFVADVVRVPVLCQYSSGPRFAHELGKLNQQAVIKGFHRLSNEAKEALIVNRSFTVELYVPPVLLDQFERAFLEEAWAVPLSTLNPGRTALYPGLAPPTTLLQYDGWIGKRQELIDGIATKGRSLLRGEKYGLDGRLIEQREVLANMRVFGAAAEQQRMLEGERQTAAAQLGVSASTTTYAPLQAGLMSDTDDAGAAATAAEDEGAASTPSPTSLSGSPAP